MAKPKQNETVVWDDDDMWADVDEVSPGETEVPAVAAELIKVAPPTSRTGTVHAVPKPEVPAKETEKLTIKPEARAIKVEMPEPVSAASKEVMPLLPGATEEVARKPHVPGVSLVKVQRAAAPAMKVEAAPARVEAVRPPPLPPVAKPPALTPKIARSAQPDLSKPPPLPAIPTLPKAPSWPKPAANSVATPAPMPVKVPLRKSPGGISSIFTQGKTDDPAEITEESIPNPPIPPKPKPRPVHPKLGPAFSRNDEPQERSEGSA